MKKLLLILSILMLNSNITLAANNLISADWWKTATLDKVKSEIANGADVNAKNNDSMTAIMIAAGISTNPEIIKTLVNAGADVNARTNEGVTALMVAIGFNKNPEIIKTLVEVGANINTKIESGESENMTPLMMAITQNPNSEVANILIKSGADVNVGFGQGAALLAAATSEKFGTHALLLQASDWKAYCKFVNKNSLKVNHCIDRMQIYADKEDQLPSCFNNMPAIALISQYFNVFNKSVNSDKNKASQVYLGMADVAAEYNCSIGKTVKKIMGK